MNSKIQLIKLYGIGAVVSMLLLFIDQLTKYLAAILLKDQPAFVIWKGVFELRYLENRGAAFGILQGKKIFFMMITIIFISILAYIFGKIPMQAHYLPLHYICIALFSGALGNFIDRTCNNYVIDFLYFCLIDFPIFNVADIYVTCAMAVFIILLLFYYKEEDLDLLSAQIFPWKKNHDGNNSK